MDTPRNLARNASGAEWAALARSGGALGPEDANLWCAATPISASARTQALLPVGRHDGPGERAPRERLPGAADAELSPAGLPEEHAAAHVGAHEHARLIAARAAHPGPASKAGSDDPITSRRRWRIEKLVRSETPQAAAQLPGVAPPAISRA